MRSVPSVPALGTVCSETKITCVCSDMCENLAVHGDLLDAYYSSELFKVDATLMRMSGVSGSGEVEHRTRRG